MTSSAFLGTPHFGSNKASWSKLGLRFADVLKKGNLNLLGALESDSEVLAHVQKDFHTMLRHYNNERGGLHITCFSEEIPYAVAGMVSVESCQSKLITFL